MKIDLSRLSSSLSLRLRMKWNFILILLLLTFIIDECISKKTAKHHSSKHHPHKGGHPAKSLKHEKFSSRPNKEGYQIPPAFKLVFSGKAGFSVLISETEPNRPVCMGAIYDEWHVLTVARCCWKFHTKEYGKGILIFGGYDWIDDDTKTTRRNVESVHMPDEYIKGLKNYESLDLYSKHDICLMKTDRQILLYKEDTKPKNLTENDPPRIWPIRITYNPTPQHYLHPSRTVCSLLGHFRYGVAFRLWRLFVKFASNSFENPEFISYLTLESYRDKRTEFYMYGMYGGVLVCPDNVTKVDWIDPNYNEGYYMMAMTINISSNPFKDNRDFIVLTPIQYFREWLSETAKHEIARTTTVQSKSTDNELVTDEEDLNQSTSTGKIIFLILIMLTLIVCIIFVNGRRRKYLKDRMKESPEGESESNGKTKQVSKLTPSKLGSKSKPRSTTASKSTVTTSADTKITNKSQIPKSKIQVLKSNLQLNSQQGMTIDIKFSEVPHKSSLKEPSKQEQPVGSKLDPKLGSKIQEKTDDKIQKLPSKKPSEPQTVSQTEVKYTASQLKGQEKSKLDKIQSQVQLKAFGSKLGSKMGFKMGSKFEGKIEKIP